eukprot:3980892-Amphidinium_carterae.1
MVSVIGLKIPSCWHWPWLAKCQPSQGTRNLNDHLCIYARTFVDCHLHCLRWICGSLGVRTGSSPVDTCSGGTTHIDFGFESRGRSKLGCQVESPLR